MAEAALDQNFKAGALGESSTTPGLTLPFLIDEITGRLLVMGSGGGGNTFYTETPAGVIDGVNADYTTAHTINSIMSFAINGQYIHPVEYSILGSTITFVTPLNSVFAGAPFTVVYT